MDAQIVDMLNNTVKVLGPVLDNAIKILGSGLIAGGVGYFTARLQYKSKLMEITGSYGFKSRETLFSYYKEKIDTAAKKGNGLLVALGVKLEHTQSSILSHDHDGFLDLCFKTYEFEIKTALRDMETANLKETDEYNRMMEYQKNAKNIQPSRVFT